MLRNTTTNHAMSHLMTTKGLVGVLCQSRLNLNLDNEGLRKWLDKALTRISELLPQNTDLPPNITLTLSAARTDSLTAPETLPNPQTVPLPTLRQSKPTTEPLQILHDFMSAQDPAWVLTRRGWPDYFAYHPDSGSVAAIIIDKHRGRSLRKHQQVILQALSNYGVPVYHFDPVKRLLHRFNLSKPQIDPPRKETTT